MKLVKPALAAAVALASLLMVHAPAEAHGRWRGGVTLHFGAPWPGYWYGPRYYAPPPVVYYPAPAYPAYTYPPPVIERAPTYVERDDPAPAAETDAPPAWWYWCADAKKYYPYVKDCPGGWRRVPAQPTN